MRKFYTNSTVILTYDIICKMLDELTMRHKFNPEYYEITDDYKQFTSTILKNSAYKQAILTRILDKELL